MNLNGKALEIIDLEVLLLDWMTISHEKYGTELSTAVFLYLYYSKIYKMMSEKEISYRKFFLI